MKHLSGYDYLKSPAPLSMMIDADAAPVSHTPPLRPIDIRYPGRDVRYAEPVCEIVTIAVDPAWKLPKRLVKVDFDLLDAYSYSLRAHELRDMTPHIPSGISTDDIALENSFVVRGKRS